MTDAASVLMFVKDFSERGGDRLFLWADGAVREIDARSLVELPERLVCHDYWLISPAIFRSVARLPANVVDVVEFERGISGRRVSRSVRERQDIRQSLLGFCEEAVVDCYLSAFYRRAELDTQILGVVGNALHRRWIELLEQARLDGELDRAMDIEVQIGRAHV